MSKTIVMSPINGVLGKSEDILGKDRLWNPVNNEQYHFLTDFFSKRDHLRGFSEKEFRNWVSRIASELNEVLRREGFDIQLQDFQDGEFGIVSILDVLVEWLVRGMKTEIYVNDTEYPAVRLENTAFEPYTSFGHRHPIAMLYTKSGDKVYMTIADRPYRDFGLIDRINGIRGDLRRASRYDYLKFPMVNLNHQVDISWLKGMWTIDANSGQRAEISQALQQVKFKMNETGARVKSAVAIGVRFVSALSNQPLVIDKPFFLWIEREGMSTPIIYAYIDQEDWKDPGNLDL